MTAQICNAEYSRNKLGNSLGLRILNRYLDNFNLLIISLYRISVFFWRYERSLLRFEITPRSPLREWLSFGFDFKCSTRLSTLWVRRAIWTSGLPVSPLFVANSLIIFCLLLESGGFAVVILQKNLNSRFRFYW